MTTVAVTANSSARRILRASSIMGGSSIVTIACGIISAKLLAVRLGPEGVGLIGLLQSAQVLTAALAGMGLSSSGVRLIAMAHANKDLSEVATVRGTLAVVSTAFGAIAALILVLYRNPLAGILLDGPARGNDIALLGLGVIASTAAVAQTALLTGRNELGRLARMQVAGAVGGLVVLAFVVLLAGGQALVLAVIGGPIIVLTASFWLTKDIARDLPPPDMTRVRKSLPPLFSLGVVFMATGLMATSTQLIIRVEINRNLGVGATGEFQAAWSISMLYLGFVLGAMAVDYYPRLSAAASDHITTNRLVNEQARTALLLTAPVVVGLAGFAPEIVRILYAGDFGNAVRILEWQTLGDLLKVPSWAMGYILLAQGRSLLYFISELSWSAIYVAAVVLGLPVLGVEITGVAFLLSYAIYFIALAMLTRRVTGFALNIHNVFLLMALFATVLIAGAARRFFGIEAIAVTAPLVVVVSLACAKTLLQDASLVLADMRHWMVFWQARKGG